MEELSMSKLDFENAIKSQFSDLIGLEEAKEIVRTQMILPLQSPEAYALYKKNKGGGMILYGPPGTGKTTFAKAIANEAEASFFYVKASDILDKFVGESVKIIASLFQSLSKEKRAVLFVDDMDSLFMKRGVDHHNDERVNEFLQQMDGFNSSKGQIMLLGATNRPWALDSAITRPGRFSRQVYIGLPNKQARIYLTKKYLEGVPLTDDFDFEAIAKLTVNYSGADIKELCEQAKVEPLMKTIFDEKKNNGTKLHLLTNDDFLKAIKLVPSSINPKELEVFEAYNQERKNSIEIEKESPDIKETKSEKFVINYDKTVSIPVNHKTSIRFVISREVKDNIYVEIDMQKYICNKELNHYESDLIYIDKPGTKVVDIYLNDKKVDSYDIQFTQGMIEESLGL
jgi:transitional endoplasmic reticulum ATPase